ncbi:MAG TPA: choice-of-anchor L domain-containing protein, partial [Candidatus Manganitrophaceae bacterium]|nr:choice-of-anchor L domain-containing protein [Candidatus Manganitrophaceae bacterium]
TVVQSQGSILPPERLNMARIDTGDAASLNKTSSITSGPITVPAGATQLMFDLNFLSDEYPTYIGQEFDDVVVATMIPSSGSPVSKRVTSVNSASFTDLQTDTTGIGFNGMTGFFPVTFDVTGSTTVILSIEISDVGDTAFDSAALIDNIRFNVTKSLANTLTKLNHVE